MQLQLLHERCGQLAPVQATVGMVDDVVAVIVGLRVVGAGKAVVCELVIITWTVWVNKDVLAPVKGRQYMGACDTVQWSSVKKATGPVLAVILTKQVYLTHHRPCVQAQERLLTASQPAAQSQVHQSAAACRIRPVHLHVALLLPLCSPRANIA